MPTYAYSCDNCGVRFDRFQSFNDPTLTVCPECGEEALRKLYLPVGVVFKGSGFYSTDHRSPSGQSSARKSDEGTTSEAKKDTGNGTGKPEKSTPSASEE